MIELAIWQHAGVPGLSEAKAQLQSIIGDQHPVPVQELGPSMQEFVREVQRRVPGIGLVGSQGPAEDSRYSRHGVVVQLGNDLPENAYELVLSTANKLKLAFYDPDMDLAVGSEDMSDIAIHDKKS
ncbi:hypothetical protein [Glycomyces paridis]|uniref:Uncharacterized protein n=1 Tax=Glycomyces paridis TaxID=2126555 RepID=A0A4S8PHN4_9ACTN|nr:hypothetical protein [Glycomyces paridis]THV30128.1 hypothetical protein E9998_07050 [Glycomyces paridis]